MFGYCLMNAAACAAVVMVEHEPRESSYVNIPIPRALVDDLRRFIDDYPELGYRSASEFSIEGVRYYIALQRERLQVARNLERPQGPMQGLKQSGVDVRRARKSK
jgi:hypothetical protein